MELEQFNKLNERIDKMGAAFGEMRNAILNPDRKHYFVRPHCSDMTDQIDTAHALSFAVLKNVHKAAQGGRGSYAKVEHCCEYLNPILSKFDLSVKQIPAYNEHGEDVLITRFSHKSGQWYESVIMLKAEKNNAQSPNQVFGSSLTYIRRYAVLAILGIGQTDDPVDMDE